MLLAVLETLDSLWQGGLYAQDGGQSKVTDERCPWSFFQARQMPSICPGLFMYHSVWQKERVGTRVQGPLASNSGRSLQINLVFTGG